MNYPISILRILVLSSAIDNRPFSLLWKFNTFFSNFIYLIKSSTFKIILIKFRFLIPYKCLEVCNNYQLIIQFLKPTTLRQFKGTLPPIQRKFSQSIRKISPTRQRTARRAHNAQLYVRVSESISQRRKKNIPKHTYFGIDDLVGIRKAIAKTEKKQHTTP